MSNDFSLSEYSKIDVGWGFAPYPTGGSLQRSPDPLVGFKGAASRQEENGGEGSEGLGVEEEGKRGERVEWEGRRKEESWGNSALVVGG